MWEDAPVYCIWTLQKFNELVKDGQETNDQYVEGESKLKRFAQWLKTKDEQSEAMASVYEYDENGEPIEKPMATTDKTAKQIFHDVINNPARKTFGFGKKIAVVNVDIQKAYTSGEFATSYETDPRQLEYVNRLCSLARGKGLPVVWTYVAYMEDGSDAGVWGTRTDTPDSLQNIKFNSRRAEFDDRLEIDHTKDAILMKKMPSCFHETSLQSLLVWHKVDTIVLTGGSTSGCIRASAVESLSRGYRTIVPIECVADKHESYHYANLTDLSLKYADVLPVEEVFAHLEK